MRRLFVLALSLTIMLPLLAVLLAFAAATSRAQCGGAVGPGDAPGVPSNLLAIYEQAADTYQLGPAGWAYLAAINEIETDYGRNLSVSTAGAVGWMQFLPLDLEAVGRRRERATASPTPTTRPTRSSPPPATCTRPAPPRACQGAIFAYNHAGLVRLPGPAARPALRADRRRQQRNPGHRHRIRGRVRHRGAHHTRTDCPHPAGRARRRASERARAGAGRDRGRQPNHRHLLQH